MGETKHEAVRASMSSFETGFSDYMIENREGNWRPTRCTFFRDGDQKRSWAYCSFERELRKANAPFISTLSRILAG